jgi:hypothetical protein
MILVFHILIFIIVMFWILLYFEDKRDFKQGLKD